MSGSGGGLRDLAAWALRGGADGDDRAATDESQQQEAPLTAEQLRAQRVARMEELRLRRLVEQEQRQQQQQQPNNNYPERMQVETASSRESVPMDIDEQPPPKSISPKQAVNTNRMPIENPSPSVSNSNMNNNNNNKRSLKKAKSDQESQLDSAKKMQRKKELLLKKVLQIALEGSATAVTTQSSSSSSSSSSSPSSYFSSTTGNEAITIVDTGSNEISTGTIAEILATRLTLEPAADNPNGLKIVAYAGRCYNQASDEIKSLQAMSRNWKPAATASPSSTELLDILQEIQRQLVSYTATCLQEPDLFPSMAHDGAIQLALVLLNPHVINITLGSASSVSAGSRSSSSFYAQLVDELETQGSTEDALRAIVSQIVDYYLQLLSDCDSVLESIGDYAPVAVVSALGRLCSHKSVAACVCTLPNFLLPAAGTVAAVELVRPTITSSSPLQQLFSANSPENRPYPKRSGPGLEKQTIFGQCLRLGAPVRSNSAFTPDHSIMRQTVAAVDGATKTQRRQLQLYQSACHQFVKQCLATSREVVLQWLTDALMVNRGAAALQPDLSKISGRNLRLNLSILLLQLCEPIVAATPAYSKQHLVDPGFVSASSELFPRTGEDAVPRLGGSDAVSTQPYQPKNAFVAHIFFATTRALHFGLVPLLDQHENLLRHMTHLHYAIRGNNDNEAMRTRFAMVLARQRTDEVALYQEDMAEMTLKFNNFTAKVLLDMDDATLRTMPEEMVTDLCEILLGIAVQCPTLLAGLEFRHVFRLVVKLLSPQYASMVRNYNLRAQLGDVLYEIFLPRPTHSRRDEVPASVAYDRLAGGQSYLLSDVSAQETLAPSLLLLYGEVEHTGYYEKMSHRAKIASLIKYLWESTEHRPAFRAITENTVSFIKFANGMMNETNTLIATVMQKLPEIREAQEKMKNVEEWGRLSAEEQEHISSRLEENERDVKSSLPLCNKTLQMFGYLNTDEDIRSLFLLEELCSRLVTMLLHVLTKLVGSKGLDLKVDNPEQYDFRPKEMLRDLCAIFALFASSEVFQTECANARCDVNMLRKAVQTCQRLNLLAGESMEAFVMLPVAVEEAAHRVALEEELLEGAPDEFLDAVMSTFMKDPVILPSSHIVDRSTITTHLLNTPIDPFSRLPLKIEEVAPATELKEKMDQWLTEKRAARDRAKKNDNNNGGSN